jgi:hypothetical protein
MIRSGTKEPKTTMRLKRWLAICCLIGAIGGVEEVWLVPTVDPSCSIALPAALAGLLLVILVGYALVDENDKLQAVLVGPAVAFVAGLIEFVIALFCALSTVKW